jgi:hypothetical protein
MRAFLAVALMLALAACTTTTPAAQSVPPALRLLRNWTPAQEAAIREEARRRPSGDAVREALIELESLETAACALTPRQSRCARICASGGPIRYGWCSDAR